MFGLDLNMMTRTSCFIFHCTVLGTFAVQDEGFRISWPQCPCYFTYTLLSGFQRLVEKFGSSVPCRREGAGFQSIGAHICTYMHIYTPAYACYISMYTWGACIHVYMYMYIYTRAVIQTYIVNLSGQKMSAAVASWSLESRAFQAPWVGVSTHMEGAGLARKLQPGFDCCCVLKGGPLLHHMHTKIHGIYLLARLAICFVMDLSFPSICLCIYPSSYLSI